MDTSDIEKPLLTDASMAAVTGLMPKLKEMVAASANAAELPALQKKARAVAEDLESLISSGKLSDADLQRLQAVLARLRGALQDGVISREALTAALTEAATAIGSADATGRNTALQQRQSQLWQQIAEHNKAIDNDFEQMRKAGIFFDEKLWSRHKELSERLQENPQDIAAQKELIAVDDQLLQQAEPQIKEHPNAQPGFDDAQRKSEERHKDVATAIALQDAVGQNVTSADMDWNNPQGEKVTLDDIASSSAGKRIAIRGNAAAARE